MGIEGLWSYLAEQDKLVDNLLGGAAFQNHCQGKIVAIDVSQWVNRAFQQAQNFPAEKYTKEEMRLHPLKCLFQRIKNYVCRGGCAYVLGVLDAPRAAPSKIVRGNVTKNGICQRRNLCGLNGAIMQMFRAFGFSACRAPDHVGEAETFMAQLQMHGIVDLLDSSDGDCFAFGATEVIISDNIDSCR